MFRCQFFDGNPNLEVSRLTKAMSRVQVNDENGNLRDQDRELFIFFKHVCDTCLYANFSMVKRVTKAMSRVQVNNENGNSRN